MATCESDIETWAKARLGTVLRGKYRLDRILGVGGMAVVYKATHRNRAEFAVKMLHPQMSLSADVLSRFLREGYAANSVRHPGAVRVVDDDVAEDGAAFLVMELLDGVGCEALWERPGGRVDAEAAGAILVQLLEVLAAAHANGVVHRDIKPANLFLTRTGAVKVLDFGIARAREALATGEHGTQSGLTMGTPGFMAPEQARGRTEEVDGRTDLWAVGATFFALVSGQLVHAGETAQELMIAAATQPATPVFEVAPDVPPAVAAIIDRALAFRREDRWASAEEMRDALLGVRRETDSVEEVVASLVSWSGASSSPPDAPTLPRPRASRAAGRAAAVGTTAPPSVNDRAPSETRSRAWATGGGIALAAIASAALALAIGGRYSGHSAARAAERESSHPAAVVAPPPSLPETSALVTTGKDEDGVAAPAASSSPAATAVVAARQAEAGPKRTVEARPARPAGSCAPNFTLDDQGRKHFKPECFLKRPQ